MSKEIKTKEDIKAETFADAYVKNGMNGTQAYKQINPRSSDEVAGVQAHRMLRKDKTQKAIAERMPSDIVLSKALKEALSVENPEIMDWSTKHKYLTTMLKLKGYLSDEHKSSINIGLFTSKD